MLKTCVVVADGGRARFFVLERDTPPFGATSTRLEELLDLANPEALLSGRELFSNPISGRNRAPSGAVYETDDHRGRHEAEIERRFARRLADAIGELLRREHADKFVLSAEPSLLGLLRPLLAQVVPLGTELVELAQDLSRHTPPRIHALLADRGALPFPKA